MRRVHYITLKNARIDIGILWVRRAILLTVALIFVCAVSPVATATRWMCEGRVCGISLWMIANCCCDAPDASERDKDCSAPRRANTTQTDSIACADGCGCEGETIQAGGDTVVSRTKASVTSEPTWATLPVTTVLFAPSFFAPVTTTLTSGRGPPACSSAPHNVSLRGPPSA